MTNDMVERALTLYVRAGFPKEKLFTDISTYIRLHYVYASPDALILARIVDGNWFVELAVGKMSRFFEVAPFRTDWVGFARTAKGRDDGKWYKFDRIERLVKGYDRSTFQRQCGLTASSSKATSA